jgi:hypothetical protein
MGNIMVRIVLSIKKVCWPASCIGQRSGGRHGWVKQRSVFLLLPSVAISGFFWEVAQVVLVVIMENRQRFLFRKIVNFGLF